VAKCDQEWGDEDALLWVQDDEYRYHPSTNWAQGGPIIERERLLIQPELGKEGAGNAWYCVAITPHDAYGETPLVAAMRCYLVSKLGDEIDVPEELL
jgi:hypothetical protein